MLCLSTGSVAGLQPQALNVVRKDFYREKASCFLSFTDNTTEEMIEQWRHWLHGAKFVVPGPPKCLWPKVGSCFFWVTLRKGRGTLRECGHHIGGRGTLRDGHCGREGHFEGEWAPWEGGAL